MAARPASDHKEAVRLAWKCRHVPFGTIALSTLLLSGVLSMVSMVWGYGPGNPIP
jgi:ABC-type transport system involved in cytochrome c biogenesis permease subunit